jgi:hypothetical protein
MAINLESFRYPFETEIANESDGAKVAHRNAFQGILDLNQAVASLKTQLTAATTTSSSSSSSTSTSTSSSTSTGTQTVVTNSATTTIGYVNDQTGVTAYSTVQSDYAKFIILDDASAIAITLSVGSSAPAITVPWYAVFLNFGAGTATLTPIDGTISYQGNLAVASMPVAQGSAATVAYDGTNFWAELIPLIGGVVTQIIAGTNVTISPTSGVGAVTVNSVVPAPTLTTLGGVEAIAQVTSEWINSISTSGVPQLSQPAVADISGLAADLALLAPLASPALTGTPTAPTATAGTDTTQIATTAFVESAISAISGAGVLLDASYVGALTLTTGAFTTLVLNTVSVDTASGYSTSTGLYTIPATGIYMIVTKLRPADGSTEFVSYGQGAGTTLADSTNFQWFMTVSTTTPSTFARNESINTRIMRLTEGQTISMFYYDDTVALTLFSDVTIGCANMSVALLGIT